LSHGVQALLRIVYCRGRRTLPMEDKPKKKNKGSRPALSARKGSKKRAGGKVIEKKKGKAILVALKGGGLPCTVERREGPVCSTPP